MENLMNESGASYQAIKSIMTLEGSGFAGSQIIVTSTTPFSVDADDDSDSDVVFAYKIECLTATCEFTALQEDGVDVDADLLDGGGSGYPIGTVLRGKFSNIEMATGHIALVSVV